MNIPGLSEADIEARAAAGSYDRGRAYFLDGAVLSVRRKSPERIEALVKGSQFLPYTVRIVHGKDSITEATCTCPYFAGAWCKHIVATLIAVIRGQAEASMDQARLARLVSELDRDSLVAVLQRIVVAHPEIEEWIREEVSSDESV